jgi:hypothetical protein
MIFSHLARLLSDKVSLRQETAILLFFRFALRMAVSLNALVDFREGGKIYALLLLYARFYPPTWANVN